jgi:RNA polymerase sigma-70 factor (ECF subfamily)
MEDADAALLSAICDGSERAFGQLIDRHQHGLRAFLRRLASMADADDIAQETFLAAWTHADTYRGGASVRSWLFAIAWRKAKDSHRRRFRQRQRDARYHEAQSAADSGGLTADDRISVLQALASLPLEQRAALTLCLANDFTHSEAADALRMPLGTVKSHVLRGRERLRMALQEEK